MVGAFGGPNNRRYRAWQLGKNINLFLMDGSVNGRIKCTLANWTGLCFKIPRTSLDLCKDRKELKQTGVYFLFGRDDQTDKSVVYVGQAGVRKNGEGILNRLCERNKNLDKDYWTEAIAIRLHLLSYYYSNRQQAL